jgi:hypothetical protein
MIWLAPRYYVFGMPFFCHFHIPVEEFASHCSEESDELYEAPGAELTSLPPVLSTTSFNSGKIL